MVTVFFLIMKPTVFRSVHSQMENYHYDRIPISLKGTRKKDLCVCVLEPDTEKLNFIKSTRNLIVFTIIKFIWIQMDVRLDPNQSENGKYNLISSLFNTISKRDLSVYVSEKVGKKFHRIGFHETCNCASFFDRT